MVFNNYIVFYIMKKYLLFLFAMLFPVMAFAAEGDVVETGDITFNFNTYDGIILAVTMIMTQVSKVWSVVNNNKWVKAAMSVAIGIILGMISWALQISDFMLGSTWYMALAKGALCGLGAAGLYPIVAAIFGLLFSKKE